MTYAPIIFKKLNLNPKISNLYPSFNEQFIGIKMVTEIYLKIKNLIADFIEDESGVTAVEYAVIAVAMSAVLLAVFKTGMMTEILNNAMTAIKANVDAAK